MCIRDRVDEKVTFVYALKGNKETEAIIIREGMDLNSIRYDAQHYLKMLSQRVDEVNKLLSKQYDASAKENFTKERGGDGVSGSQTDGGEGRKEGDGR